MTNPGRIFDIERGCDEGRRDEGYGCFHLVPAEPSNLGWTAVINLGVIWRLTVLWCRRGRKLISQILMGSSNLNRDCGRHGWSGSDFWRSTRVVMDYGARVDVSEARVAWNLDIRPTSTIED